MENKGKLLVSTKSAASKLKTVQLIASAIPVFFGFLLLIIFSAMDLWRDFGREVLGDASLGWIAGLFIIIVLIAWPVHQLLTTFVGSKSYCDVYENGVEGLTGLKLKDPNSPMKSFDIGYDEILNVSESGTQILIYTQYTTYNVLAMVNRAEALKEIKARVAAQKQQANTGN